MRVVSGQLSVASEICGCFGRRDSTKISATISMPIAAMKLARLPNRSDSSPKTIGIIPINTVIRLVYAVFSRIRSGFEQLTNFWRMAMFSFLDRPVRLCDGFARRELLRIGGLNALGLSLPNLLQADEAIPASISSVDKSG